MTKPVELTVPNIGDFEDVEIIEVLVAPGDKVNVEDPLVSIESDKATMEVPASHAGTITKLRVAVGDKVSEGSVIALLEAAGDAGGETAAAPDDTPSPDKAAAGENQTAKVPADEEPATTTPASSDSETVIAVPDIGDFSEVEVIEVYVKPGDTVAVEDSLIALESDKATMDVPASHAGTVKELKVSAGDRVSEGTAIVVLTGAEAAPADAPPAVDKTPHTEPPQTRESPARPRPERPSPPPTLPPPPAQKSGVAPPHASPGVRRFARELGVDLSRIRGSGPKTRILKEDVKTFVKTTLGGAVAPAPESAGSTGIPPIPAVDFSKWGEIEVRELPRIKKLSGAHLHRAWLNVPHVTHHDEADVTELERFRRSIRDEAESKNVRVTALAFIMKAVATALKLFPYFNASLSADGEQLILKKYIHIGIAVDTPNGLVVPVFRDVDTKGVYELASEMADISQRARDGKLKLDEMQGGSMSISSLGGIGGSAFTPIVNAPEVAILGVTRAQMKPVWNGTEFMPRQLLPLDLSYDHRVIDGAEAARFLAYLCKTLGDLPRLLL